MRTTTPNRSARRSRRARVPARTVRAAAVTLGLLSVVAAVGLLPVSAAPPRSPAELTAGSRVTRHFEYVLTSGQIHVYDIDRGNTLVQTLSVPQIEGDPHGVVAGPATRRLYVSYGGEGGSTGTGSMLALDLRSGHVLWVRAYPTGIDSMAISPDGRTIYMPVGESSGSGTWSVIAASNGSVIGSIQAGAGAHNTVMSLDGRYVYLGGVDHPYLDVASTATRKVVREIGPLNGPGVRPFTINGAGTLAFTTARSFLGFQVSSVATGRVLYTVGVPGFSWDPTTFARTPDHGISLSPDERELYLIDTPNGYVHVFDVSGLPASAPRDVADIKLAHPPPNDGWLQHSRNGRFVYVGRAGDVIDTLTRKVVAFLPPLQQTADFLEIDWRNGLPVATTSRYGHGYVVHR
jgi:DNA-binding beta-propeller fold protein YncE